ncbi:MAG: hypothetical protein ABI651_04680 [Verrucomicrobiota bacterium]
MKSKVMAAIGIAQPMTMATSGINNAGAKCIIVPFFFWFPGFARSGNQPGHPVSSCDFGPLEIVSRN